MHTKGRSILVEVDILLAKPLFAPKRGGRKLFGLATTDSRRCLCLHRAGPEPIRTQATLDDAAFPTQTAATQHSFEHHESHTTYIIYLF